MTHSNSLKITFVALLAAIISVLSILPLPFSFLGVPMTLQTFAVAFCGFLLGWKLGLASVSLYLFLGSIGVPVFSNLQGGFHRLVGPTGGFLWGFLFLVFFCGLSLHLPTFKRRGLHRFFSILLGIAGLLFCHLFGVLQFSAVNAIPFPQALAGVSLPFLPKDVFSVVLAFVLAALVRRRLPFDPKTMKKR